MLKDYGTKYSDMFQIASAIIVVSHDMKQQLLKLGVPKEKLFYNSCGADTSLFSYSDSALSLPVFISTGRFVEKKAPHLTIMSFKKVIESCPDARLLMIGDGPLWEACKQIVKVLGMTETVQFLGPLPHMEVASLMQKARAFVQHSVTTGNGDSEGTPVAVLEAGSSGLPVISTRHAGIQDAVLDGETGLLVDEFDIDGMAKHMIRLAEDSELATRLGSAARKHICSEFSMEKSINGLWRIIEQTLKE